ncbi:MAG TPA: proline racemase family protein [Candidatus Limnocylindria bacterium]
MAVASDQPRLYAARAGTADWGISVLKARGVAHRGPEPSWVPPSDWRRFETLDAHAAGEPLRLVVSGVPPIPGATMVERRLYAREHLDDLRRALMFEPRGHADMYGAILTAPATDDADAGVLFMHNEGWSTMCGHGVIAVVTAGIEAGLLPRRSPVRLDTPAGRVSAHSTISGERVERVRFENVPAFVLALDESVEVGGLGRVRYDLAFGGAFYAYVDATALGFELVPERARELIEAGSAIKAAVVRARPIEHPFEPELSFLYGTIFVGPGRNAPGSSRHVCIFAAGELDRSPTGTGVSGRAAIEHARGRVAIGERFVVESIIGSEFTGLVERATTFGPHPAVVPSVEGRAWITGRHRFYVAPDDPFAGGFLIR